MKREIIRVEPLSTYLENGKMPTSAVTRCGDPIYVSGFPAFDPATSSRTRTSTDCRSEPELSAVLLVLQRLQNAT